jgi:hypothetical protein
MMSRRGTRRGLRYRFCRERLAHATPELPQAGVAPGVRRVAEGGSILDPLSSPNSLTRRRAGDDPLGELTDRELEVLALRPRDDPTALSLTDSSSPRTRVEHLLEARHPAERRRPPTCARRGAFLNAG